MNSYSFFIFLRNENQLDSDSHNGNTICLSRYNAVSGDCKEPVHKWSVNKKKENIYYE